MDLYECNPRYTHDTAMINLPKRESIFYVQDHIRDVHPFSLNKELYYFVTMRTIYLSGKVNVRTWQKMV
jgi:hypothetical protein